MSRAEEYARDVLSGKQVAGRLIHLAAKRFLSDLERTDIRFDEVEANKFISFAEGSCRLFEDQWRGQPVIIKPWMAFIFQQIFGWIVVSTGLRRVKQVYVQVAKKNAKSTLAGVLGNYHLFSDERIQTPKVYVGANNEDQAKICVNMTGKMIENSPDLAEYLTDDEVRIFRYMKDIREIVHDGRDGFITALSKETGDKESKTAGGKHGINPSLGIVDEYAMAADDSLLNTVESAQAARQEPLMFVITTAGFNLNGPCYQKLRQTGVNVLEGTQHDDSYLVFLYEMDSPVDEKGVKQKITVDYLLANEDKWVECNPNIDVSVNRDFLRTRLQKAKNEGGTKIVDVLTLNFDEWQETPEVWIPKETHDKNVHGVTEAELKSTECFGGLQLLTAKELNAFALYFPHVRPNVDAVKLLFWMPEAAKIDEQTKMDFGRWISEGWITTCPGNTIDNEFIFLRLIEEIAQYNIHSIAYPVNKENSDIVQRLTSEGIVCNPISQGYRANSEPTSEWEKLITAGQIDHFGNPVLSWTNSNCMALRKGDDIRVERVGGKTAGIVAAINALAQWKTVEADGKMTDFEFKSL